MGQTWGTIHEPPQTGTIHEPSQTGTIHEPPPLPITFTIPKPPPLPITFTIIHNKPIVTALKPPLQPFQNVEKSVSITIKSYQHSQSFDFSFHSQDSLRLCFENIEKAFSERVEDSSKFVLRDAISFKEIQFCWLVKTFEEVGWEHNILLVFFTKVEESYKNPPRIKLPTVNMDNTIKRTSINPQKLSQILQASQTKDPSSQTKDPSLLNNIPTSKNSDLTITITPSLPPRPTNDITAVTIQNENKDCLDDCNDENINITQMSYGGRAVRVDQKLGNIPILGESKVLCVSQNGGVKFPDGNSFLSYSSTPNDNKLLLTKYPIIEDLLMRKMSALMSVKRVITLLGTDVKNSEITVKESSDPCFFMCEVESSNAQATSELLWQYSDTQYLLVWRVIIKYRDMRKIAFVDEENQIVSGIERHECAVSISAVYKNPREKAELLTVSISPNWVEHPEKPTTKGPYCRAIIKRSFLQSIKDKISNTLNAVVAGDKAVFKCKKDYDYWRISSFVYVCRVAKVMEQCGFKGWGSLKGKNHRIVIECTNEHLYGVSSMNTPDIRENKNPVMQLGYDTDNIHTAYCFHTIFHEYTHAVVDRLLGGSGNCVCPQACALTEGLADFFPCCYTDSEYFAPESCPRGPYNARFREKMTFARLKILVFDEHVHGQLLCATLMEMSRFIGDKEVAMKLVLDALRCCPSNPGFLQFRECLIIVSIESYSSDPNRAKFYMQCIRRAFAYFGMGCHAKCDPYYFTDIVEDFTEDDHLNCYDELHGLDGNPKLDRSKSHERLRIHANGLLVEHVGEKLETNQSAITTHPLDEDWPYFEVEIESVMKKKLDSTGSGVVAVGIGPQDYCMDDLPGWKNDSCAFHTDDCKFYYDYVGESTSMDVTQTPKVIGIGITMNNECYLTVDQKLLVSMTIGNFGFGQLYPIIGLDEARVMCNFGQKPFLFRTISVKNSSPSIKHYIEPQLLSHTGDLNTNQMAKCTHYFHDQFNYFQIEILKLSKKGLVAIGLTTINIPVDKQPGWTTNSFGLHSDNGKFYNQQYNTYHKDNVQVIDNPPVRDGDTLGCGVDGNQLYFTRNGKKIHSVNIQGLSELQLYPSIGLDNAEVLYNFNT